MSDVQLPVPWDALALIRRAIEAVPSDDWEDGQENGHPLWEALDRIDSIVMGVMLLAPKATVFGSSEQAQP